MQTLVTTSGEGAAPRPFLVISSTTARGPQLGKEVLCFHFLCLEAELQKVFSSSLWTVLATLQSGPRWRPRGILLDRQLFSMKTMRAVLTRRCQSSASLPPITEAPSVLMAAHFVQPGLLCGMESLCE